MYTICFALVTISLIRASYSQKVDEAVGPDVDPFLLLLGLAVGKGLVSQSCPHSWGFKNVI